MVIILENYTCSAGNWENFMHQTGMKHHNCHIIHGLGTEFMKFVVLVPYTKSSASVWRKSGRNQYQNSGKVMLIFDGILVLFEEAPAMPARTSRPRATAVARQKNWRPNSIALPFKRRV